jgi:hypothetical protein
MSNSQYGLPLLDGCQRPVQPISETRDSNCRIRIRIGAGRLSASSVRCQCQSIVFVYRPTRILARNEQGGGKGH